MEKKPPVVPQTDVTTPEQEQLPEVSLPEAQEPQTPPAPVTEPDLQHETVNPAEVAQSLRQAIVRITDHTRDTGLISLLHQYLRCISPKFAEEGDQRFPRSLTPHKRNKLNCVHSRFGNVLCHHVGSAILGYYELVRGNRTSVGRAAIAKLLDIADAPTHYRVVGSPNEGYCLMTEAEARAALPNQQTARK